MILNLFTIVTIISLFLAIVLSVFFFATKKGSGLENKILAILLIVFNFQIFYSFTVSNYTFQYFLNSHKAIFILRQSSFLMGPLIFLYINSFLKRKFVFQPNTLLHFVPFFAAVVFLLLYFRNTDQFIIWESPFDLYSTILILAHNFVYIWMSLISMKSMNISFRGLYKRIKISAPYTWLQILLLGFIIIWVVHLNSFAIFMIVKIPGWCAYTGSIFALVVFIFVNTLMFLLLLKPNVYYIIEKYKNNKVKDADKKEYLQRLNNYIVNEKAYLNPDISLEYVAREISVNSRILSQIINETFNRNFKGYILEFRLKESMQILADEKCRELTILEILYKAGFNSKSAFNNQFKLYTNLTPQEYRSKFVNS